MPHVVRSVSVLEGHRLRLEFDDGRGGEVDVAARVAFDGVFEPLLDPEYFRRVRIDREAGTVCWPNGADLDPDVLYRVATDTPPGVGDSPNSHEPAVSRTPPPRNPAPGTNATVPEICRFFGIIIRMYYDDHRPPHFHVCYSGHAATVTIAELALIEGGLPARALGLVVEWAVLHRRELEENWERARRHEPLVPIAALE